MADEARMEELRQRCRLGNDKLNIAWRQIREMDHGTDFYKEQADKWTAATKKLMDMAAELKANDFNVCLYMEGENKTKKCLAQEDSLTCWACTSEYPHWLDELMGLPGPGTQTELFEKPAKIIFTGKPKE